MNTTKKKPLTRVARTAISFLLLATASQAAMITAGSGSYLGALPIDHTTTVLTPAFTQFDPLLGVLQAIHFNFLTSLAGVVQIEDSSGVDSTVDVTVTEQLRLYDVTDTTVLALTNVSATETNISIPGNGTLVAVPISFSDQATSATLTDTTLFAPFIGTGTVQLPVGAVFFASTNPLLPLPFSLSGEGSTHGSVELVYEYEAASSAIPEPATAAFMGIGLLLIGFAARRYGRTARS